MYFAGQYCTPVIEMPGRNSPSFVWSNNLSLICFCLGGNFRKLFPCGILFCSVHNLSNLYRLINLFFEPNFEHFYKVCKARVSNIWSEYEKCVSMKSQTLQQFGFLQKVIAISSVVLVPRERGGWDLRSAEQAERSRVRGVPDTRHSHVRRQGLPPCQRVLR